MFSWFFGGCWIILFGVEGGEKEDFVVELVCVLVWCRGLCGCFIGCGNDVGESWFLVVVVWVWG